MNNPIFNTMLGNASRDPFGSMQGFMNQFCSFMQNPVGVMAQRKLNLPQNWQQDPNGAIQNLLNSGQMSQQQYDQLRQMAGQIQANPQFSQMMGGQRNNSR